MAKDPFNSIPSIEEDRLQEAADPARAAFSSSASENVTKGTAPRNLTRSVSKFALPLAVAGIAIWLLMPAGGPTKQGRSIEAVVDPTTQAAQTNAMIESLKSDANKVPRKSDHANFVSTVPAPLPTAPLPLGPDPEQEKRRAEAERREWEIRSSPLVANGTFTLSTEDAPLTPRRTRGIDVQAEIAANEAARTAAGREQERLLERALAASQEPAPMKHKGANVAFMEEQASASKRHDVERVQASASRHVVNQGTVVRAVLLTGVNSDLPGTVKAQVTSDVYDSTYQRHVLIPKGSVLIGAYNSEVMIGQERLMMAMTRVIFPNGTWASLSGASASDGIGQSGMAADVNNHFMKIFGTSLVLGVASAFLPDRQNTITMSNTEGGVTQGGTTLGLALNDTLRTILERNRNISPTLTLTPGQQFTLLVAKDMALPPYR